MLKSFRRFATSWHRGMPFPIEFDPRPRREGHAEFKVEHDLDLDVDVSFK